MPCRVKKIAQILEKSRKQRYREIDSKNNPVHNSINYRNVQPAE
jgi:hypothetical protein